MPPQDRRERFESFLALLNARDFESLAEFTESQVEFHSLFGGSEGVEAYNGLDGLRKWAEGVDEVWEDWHQEVVEFRDLAEDQALVITRVTARARESGVPLDTHNANVVTWREDGSTVLVAYSDPAEAYRGPGPAGVTTRPDPPLRGPGRGRSRTPRLIRSPSKA